MFFQIFLYNMDTENKGIEAQGAVDTAATEAAQKAANELRIAELTTSITKRSKILVMLKGLPEDEQDAGAISESERAIEKMRSEIAKIQFGSISAAVVAQGETIAQKLQASLSEVITLSANQAAVITISILGSKDGDGKGYDVKFRLTTNGAAEKSETETTEGAGTRKGIALVYNGVTYPSAAKCAEAIHAAQGKKMAEGSVNWLKWIKTHNAKENLGVTYAESGALVA